MDINVQNHSDFSRLVQLKWKKTVKSWLLMDSPIPALSIVVVYLVFVKKIGPWLMKNRAPYNLQNILMVYNAFQVTLSSYIFYIGIEGIIWKLGLIPKCVLKSSNEEVLAMELLSGIHYYLIAKTTELLDTVFFVLRKKQSHISFLHLYHHTLMFTMTWFSLKYYPNENGLFMGTINSGVHVIMYTYYGLSAFPVLKKYLWWKKYITTMQMIQFLSMFLHMIATLCVSECPPSKLQQALLLGNCIVFLSLFYDFYQKNYNKTKRVINNGEINGMNINEHTTETTNKEKHEDIFKKYYTSDKKKLHEQ